MQIVSINSAQSFEHREKKRTWITYHIEAERKPTGDTVGRTPNNEEKMWKIK